ncbi:MAG TPA: TIGR00269 family protein [Nanoarchaeota archaeon]|nr:TIGR00269 family protein [Candidatus Woesearchaeota archaeon]HIH15325.1 TIGR00269 family protein [Nanoarchaeota archaeon]HIH59215.1 TIGR00269 family protein [Nanoarchaeota archaeon]HII13470.1 TIGR00269 family protein [Nanoarchaeota archaeon]HIJ05559.1 TIGR00269 family protein [Nanoarchaeota archaeon]
MCNNCPKNPVYKLHSGEQLCQNCFFKYFEKKVRKTIRVYKLVEKKDEIAVAVSGGKDSLTVLDILYNIYKENKKITLKALMIDEGIKGYRNECIAPTKKFCKERKIPLEIVSYKKEFSFDLDQVVKGRKPCSVCGVLRRSLLNSYAKKLQVKKLATGHNLDDEAQTIIMNQFRKNIGASARLGPMTGIEDHEAFVRRIKPLYFMSEKEIMTYAFLKGIVREFNECPYNKESYRNQVREMLNNFEELYPGTKHSIVSSFMEILPALQKQEKKGKIKYCMKCKEPSSQDVCQKCAVLEQLKLPQ